MEFALSDKWVRKVYPPYNNVLWPVGQENSTLGCQKLDRPLFLKNYSGRAWVEFQCPIKIHKTDTLIP